MISKESKIFIAGHKGMVGSACWRLYKDLGYSNLIGIDSNDLDLRTQSSVKDFISEKKPDLIINAAAKVGGIFANESFPYDFLMDNLLIQNNLIKAAKELNVKKFIFLGSSCIYPKLAMQPIKEDYLMSGKLEETNEWYAIAKISGLKLIESINKQFGFQYLSLMPTNLYGPNDNFDLKSSHVLPAMIRKFHESKINNSPVELWGSGTPLREFLHVDDLAQAILKLSIKESVKYNLYNVGSGYEISIKNLALLISKIVGFKGDIVWNSKMKDGTPRKLLNNDRIFSEGWSPTIKLEQGIEKTYLWFIENEYDK